MTPDDLAQVLTGPAKHKSLFMQEFIYFRAGRWKRPQGRQMASRPQSGSWLTLEMGAGALSPLLVWEQGPSSALVPRGPEASGPPLPLHQAVCVSPCVCLWGVTRHPASLPS